ncbi:MAG: winged helix-turn-helix domain-containing protein, partial [Lachnospiraceae bacterium]|nr:winged helix-turn-helix domain-containing protein [Lachnospiraceae bacterium]
SKKVQLRGGTAADAKTRLTYDDIVVDTTTHHVRVRDQDVRLTRTEYAILKLLMLNPAQVITKTLLLDRLSEETPDCMESSLRVHISNLRRKLRDSGGKDYIESVWGIGFKMK